MAESFLIKEPFRIVRQEGDTGQIVFELPVEIPMADKEVKFQVKTSNQALVFEKLNADVTVAGQEVTIPLIAADTKGKYGKHIWELQVNSVSEIITVAKGPFEITREVIT